MTTRDTNTKHRYFYTDPLAAAWMGQHFNMVTYIGRLPDDWDAYGQPNWHQCADDWKYRQEKMEQPAPKFYIHPDSLHLLEPQVGDMITHFGLRAWRIDSMDAYAYFHPNMPNESIGRFTLKADNPTIIQRDGKSFMWPESEAV